METAAEMAKRFGLEQYLDRPAELNELILRLLLLQETMQFEAGARLRNSADAGGAISVRREAAGKFVVHCQGDPAYRYAVETALKGATSLIPCFHLKRFSGLLARMGVPPEQAARFCATAAVSDDTLCIDPE